MKKIVIVLMMIIVVGEIILTIFYNIAILPIGKEIVEELREFFSNNIDRYYEGAGHSDETGVSCFPADAFDIRKRLNCDSNLIVKWITFKFNNFSTNCKEIGEDMLYFLHPYDSPKWWPANLQKTFFPRDRSEYKFYYCKDNSTYTNLFYLEFYAIDNKSKTGYYWNMPSSDLKHNELKKYR